MKYKYGNSWEKYSIAPGEIWKESQTGSIVSVADITRTKPDYMLDADMIYCDPPWSQSNVNCFYTKAEITDRYVNSFDEFYEHLFQFIKKIQASVCYLEIGKEYNDTFRKELLKIYPSMQFWGIRYYKKNPCYLLRAGNLTHQPFDFTGMDDTLTPAKAIALEKPKCVADPCTGQGLTAIAAYKQGVKFVGTELNERRLAVTIDKVNKLGGQYENTVS